MGMTPEEFDEFYLQCYERLCNQVYAMCGNRDTAQECVQEAFAKAWSRRHQLNRDANPEGWVRTTAIRTALNHWRRWRRQQDPLPPASDPAPDPHTDDRMAIIQALQHLKPDHRRAVVLHYFADLSTEDIASELHVRPATVRTWLSRGRKQLAQFLAPPKGATHV